MNLTLKNIKWSEFIIGSEFTVVNSKAYHKSDLQEVKHGGISYVSRTNNNNGVESIVRKEDFIVNPRNSISFGAENATFFFQPNYYITGNKMYYLINDKVNCYSGLFIQKMLNKSIENCGFGYGKGLTGTRVSKRFISLPIDSKNRPDYDFMASFVLNRLRIHLKKYVNYIEKRLDNLGKVVKVIPLNEKTWLEFSIEDILVINSGSRLTKANMKPGTKPFIGAIDSNNGITAFVSNSNPSEDSNVLGVNYNGSVVENFYHPYQALFTDDVKRLSLKDIQGNKYIYLFLKSLILKQKIKYQYGYKFNGKRMSRQKILLPVDNNNKPDYSYMENYVKNLEYRKLNNYLQFENKTISSSSLLDL